MKYDKDTFFYIDDDEVETQLSCGVIKEQLKLFDFKRLGCWRSVLLGCKQFVFM